jgi:hypothetical protein
MRNKERQQKDSIPKGTTQVLHTGNLSKVAYAVVLNLFQRGIQVLLMLSTGPIGTGCHLLQFDSNLFKLIV